MVLHVIPAVNLKQGETFTIEALQVQKDKKVKSYKGIKFESGDKSIATVNKKGVVTAKGKGTVVIYVYAQNGVCKKVKVTVK